MWMNKLNKSLLVSLRYTSYEVLSIRKKNKNLEKNTFDIEKEKEFQT